MSFNSLIKIIITLLVIFQVMSGVSHAEKLEIVPGTILILPENSTVKVKWIISPSTDKEKTELFNYGLIQLGIDHKNTFFIALDGRLLMNPLTGSIIRFRQPFKKMVCLTNGALVFSDVESLFYAEVGKDK